MRLLLYPALLVKFWLVLDGFPLPERLLVVACQFLLCCFNAGAPAGRAPASSGPAALTPMRVLAVTCRSLLCCMCGCVGTSSTATVFCSR